MFDLLLNHSFDRSCIGNKTLCPGVENTGGWISENDESGTGIKNVYERLATCYSGNHTFDIDKEGKGLSQPFRISRLFFNKIREKLT